MARRVTYVEIDIDYCANVYGVAPCTASIPTTGAIKCFNSPRTCQDRDHFINAPVTLRFTMPSADLPGVNGADGPGPHVVVINEPNATQSAILATRIDRSQKLIARSVVSKIGVYSQTSGQVIIKIARRNYDDNWDIVVNESFTHPGTGWFDKTLTSPFVVPVSGDYYLGSSNSGIATIDVATPVVRTTKAGNVTGTGVTGWNDDAAGVIPMRYTYTKDALIEAIPSIKSVSVTPATVSLGRDLGQRETVSVTFNDHLSADSGPGFDKYLADRGYNPYRQGSFWGKFRARHPYVRGRALRLIRGIHGQPLAEMETRHYVLESFDGPSLAGEFTLVAQDVLKLADGDRAQAPRANNGFLLNAINNTATSATLTPSGIGNAEYPAAGYAALGGNEICAFTRSGDSLTLTRGQLGTVASSHAAQDRVQVCTRYSANTVAEILLSLLGNFAGVSRSFIEFAEWQAEAEFLNRLYTATIAEPTGVSTLVAELIEQAGLVVWWDAINQKIRMQVLRGIATDADVFSADTIMEGSFRSKEQPETRLSRVQTYYGQRNPLEKVDDPQNYRSMAETADEQAEDDYGSAAIKTVYGRWIPAAARTTATRLNEILLSRFRDTPRKFNLSLLASTATNVFLAGGYRLTFTTLQDETGAPESVPIQITQINARDDRVEVQAEEMLYAEVAEDLTQRLITIDYNANNLNLRSIHDQIFPAPTSGITVTCIIAAGVTVGSTSAGLPAFDIGNWPAGVTIDLKVYGRLQGAGGNGGYGGTQGIIPNGAPGTPGTAGGRALRARYPFNLHNFGAVWGGGGGGGGGAAQAFVPGPGGGGGGGAGVQPGIRGVPGAGGGASPGQNGNPNQGGQGGPSSGGGRGGDGGAPGQPGQAGQNIVVAGSPSGAIALGGTPGAAGAGIDGVSYCTKTVAGDIRGPQIN